MQPNQFIQVSGCITQERYIKGKTLPEIERILGFQKDRLKEGMTVAVLTQVPSTHQFELLGYSQVAGHRFTSRATEGLDVDKLKETVVRDTFTVFGLNRLVKVTAVTPHDESIPNDTQYPPGLGVPQWKLTTRMTARIVDIIQPGETYK